MIRPPISVRWLFPYRTWKRKDQNTVYLTFDDGPTEELTHRILSILREHDVKASFFCVGYNAKEHPKTMQLILDEGHVVGNHTMRHENANKVDRAVYMNSVKEAADHIDSAFFRPPYGRMPITYDKEIRRNYEIIMWSWLSYDFDPKVEIKDILSSAESIRGGDILVLHDNEKVTERVLTLLPEVIRIVKSKGLKFSTLSA